jgi:hypothetical protein
MFRDRDLFLLGAGALLSALCLLLPLPFTGKLIAGVATLVGFMTLALLRLGPDRVPLEVWLLRRLRFWLSPHRFVYQRPGWKATFGRKPSRQAANPGKADAPAIPGPPSLRIPQIGLQPLALALPEGGLYPLVTVLLAILGVYFLAWLAQGGASEIAAVFR